MPRPKRPIHIISRPIAREFRPEGIKQNTDEKVVLSIEEFEDQANRLETGLVAVKKQLNTFATPE